MWNILCEYITGGSFLAEAEDKGRERIIMKESGIIDLIVKSLYEIEG